MMVRSLPLLVLAGLLALGTAAAAAPAELVLPIGPRLPLAPGAAWNAQDAERRGEPGACVVVDEVVRSEGGEPSYGLVVLSRAGGRLVLGIHVSVPVATERLVAPVLTDAARRLGRAEPKAFETLCGDGFIGAVAIGASYFAELELDPREAPRAMGVLTPGSWSQPEPFREAVEAVIGRARVAARVLPGGSRVDAVSQPPEEVLERALAFPATVAADGASPYLAEYHAWPRDAFSGMPMELAAPTWRDVAEAVFRNDPSRGGVGGRSRAERLAEMRKAVVKRDAPEPPPFVPPPAAPAPADDSPRAAAEALARAPTAADVRVRSAAALVFDAPLPVFATTAAPGGLYAARVRERAYWVPGAAEASDTVREALAQAERAGAPTRGTTIVTAEVGATTVVFTDVRPLPGIHAAPAGERFAWIAGVAEPSPAQREALSAAIAAEASR